MQQLTNASSKLRETSGHAEAHVSYGYWMITSDSPAVARGVWNMTKTFMVCACTCACGPVLRRRARAENVYVISSTVCMLKRGEFGALNLAVSVNIANSEHAGVDRGIPGCAFGRRCCAHNR